MKEAEELERLVRQLPPLTLPLRLKEDCPLPLTAHTSAEIDIYQGIIRHQTLARVLEQTPMTDVKALRLAHALVRKGVFAITESEDSLLEQTSVIRRSPL
jgi:hypothetical protein